jgi:hypothetical protein
LQGAIAGEEAGGEEEDGFDDEEEEEATLLLPEAAAPDQVCGGKREFCVDNLLVRIHFIVEMVFVDRFCAMVV